MLKEVIKFVEKNKIGEQSNVVEDWKDKKFFVIKTKEENNQLVYDTKLILEQPDEISDWLDENNHYKDIIEHLSDYILPIDLNKALGSSSGLATCSFFVFKLSEKNLGSLEKKIIKTKFSDKRDEELNIKYIHQILKDAKQHLIEKTENEFKFLDFVALIHTDEERFATWKRVTEDFIKEKTSYGKKNLQTDGKCFVCGKIGRCSSPDFLFNNNENKIFLRHVTRNSVDGKKMALLTCPECVLKSNNFKDFLRKYKIKIFTLFIDDTLDDIDWLTDDLRDSKNKFAFIFDQLKNKGKNIFDFYLVAKSGDYFSFDYVSGYTWNLGEYVDFFNNTKIPITRHDVEMKISKIISDKPYVEYFDKLKGKDNQETNMIYSLRQKLFDFTYRNQTTITSRDIESMILFRIEKQIRNDSVDSKDCRETLNLFFNRVILLQTRVEENLLEQVSKPKSAIASGNFDEFKIQNDEEWAYFTGQLAHYLISLSKSKKMNYGLLEPFTNKSTTNLVKMTISEMCDRYKHEINLDNKHFRTIASHILGYGIDRTFIDLKIPFYIGVFDKSLLEEKGMMH